MIGDGFDLHGPWRDAAEMIARVMTTSIDPRDLVLPGGPSSEFGIERYAREYCVASGRSNLAMIYAIASVGVCTATQGGWVLQVPLSSGGWLDIPPIQYVVGIAPSGLRKSTALDAARKPLLRALGAGVRTRTARTAQQRSFAETNARQRITDEQGAGARIDPKQFATIYNAGICPVTVVKDPTMEALAQILANNGGAGSIMDAEANVFRSMTAYNPDGGNLSLLLDGWSQEGLSTARVGRGFVEMPEVALSLAVLFQQEVFADVTGGLSARIGGTDSFITRGFFGRCHVVRAADLGGYEALSRHYAEDADCDWIGEDGMASPDGTLTGLGAALFAYEESLKSLVRDSDAYRMNKALHRAWEMGLVEHGADLQVPEPEMAQRHILSLSGPSKGRREARRAYRKVQRMQLAIECALADDRVDPDVRDVFTPLAARFTQHVMREAMVVALGGGWREVTAATIEDAATRLVPWRIANTADALLTRAAEVAAVAVREAAISNPTGADLSTEGAVLRQLARLAQANPKARAVGFTRGQVREAVKGTLRRVRGTGSGVGDLVRDTLEALAARPDSGVVRAADTHDGKGEPVPRYVIEDRAISANL